LLSELKASRYIYVIITLIFKFWQTVLKRFKDKERILCIIRLNLITDKYIDSISGNHSSLKKNDENIIYEITLLLDYDLQSLLRISTSPKYHFYKMTQIYFRIIHLLFLSKYRWRDTSLKLILLTNKFNMMSVEHNDRNPEKQTAVSLFYDSGIFIKIPE